MGSRRCRRDIKPFGTHVLEPEQPFSDVVNKIIIAGRVIRSQFQEEFASEREFDILAVQLLVRNRYTIENSTLGLYVLDVCLGDNVKGEFAGQHEVWLSLWLYQALPFRGRGRTCSGQCIRWNSCQAPR
jgi:hypothetical protein